MTEDNDLSGVRSNLGCMTLMLTVFLGVVLISVTPELIAFLQSWLRRHT